MNIQPSASDPPGAASTKTKAWTIAAIAALVLIVAATFAPAATGDFIFLDDPIYVFSNPHVLGGLNGENFTWAWRTHNEAGLWIPLTWLSLQADASLSAGRMSPEVITGPVLDGAPPPLPSAAVYHVDNILQHVLGAVLLFLLLLRATRLRWPALATALLWAVHPLRVESVAWVTERKDVLSGIFCFLAMITYVAWIRRGGAWRYGLMCAAGALGILAKPMLVMLPVLLLVMDGWPLGQLRGAREAMRRVVEKLPLFVISAAAGVVTILAQRDVGALPTLQRMGLLQRLGHAAVSGVTYLLRQARVWDLSYFYVYKKADGAAAIVASVAILAAITGICMWQRRKRPWLLAGWLWYLVALLPVSGILQAGEQSYADRFTYLPAIGLFIMAAYTLADWCGGKNRAWRAQAALTGGAAVALFFIGFAWRQATYWRGTIPLVEHAIAVTGDNANVENVLGVAMLRTGKNDQAGEHFRRCTEFLPDSVKAWLALGKLDFELHRIDSALVELATAERLDPHNKWAHFYHGAAFKRAGHLEAALLEYANTLRLDPHDAQARNDFARLWADPAVRQAALRIVPNLQPPP